MANEFKNRLLVTRMTVASKLQSIREQIQRSLENEVLVAQRQIDRIAEDGWSDVYGSSIDSSWRQQLPGLMQQQREVADELKMLDTLIAAYDADK